MIKTLLTGFIFGLILILFVPATLILASWNAVPGDSVYSVKVGLEKAILGITPSDNLKTTLEIKYTERRFSEVEKIISTNTSKQDKNLNESLVNLTNQAIASKNSLQKIQNSNEKIAQTENLISTLESISSKIEEKKQASNTTSVPTKIPTKIPTKVPTNTPVVTNIKSSPIITDKPSSTLTPISTLIPTVIPTSTENIQPIINPPNLGDTQEIIIGLIDDLKKSSTKFNIENQTEKNNPKGSRDNYLKEDNIDKNKDNKDRNIRRP